MSENDGTVLIVDDEIGICHMLSRLLKDKGLQTFIAREGDAALKLIMEKMPDVLLVDFKMPGMDGLDLMKRARKVDQDLPVVMITGYADVPGAVVAMKAGAYDYLAKPFQHDEVVGVTFQALQERKLKRNLSLLSGQIHEGCSLREAMGPSDVISKLIIKVNRVAKCNFSVLLQGETGSGKELVARSIHRASSRSGNPFIPVDCGAIPETLLESELFGYEKGAFTGAQRQKKGKFEMAKNGTLFLDEISNMPLSSQAKLLRVLQDKRLFRVGGTEGLRIDVRLLVASNENLQGAVKAGTFRHDLFYRMNEFPIRIPPLRERKADIHYLAKRFLDMTNMELGKMVKGLTDRAMEALIAYEWPGNVRELRSTIRRAVLISDDMVHKKHLNINKEPGSGQGAAPPKQEEGWEGQSLKKAVQRHTLSLERKIIKQALTYTAGNKARAARLLQIDYKTIHTKIKQMGISIDGGIYERKER